MKTPREANSQQDAQCSSLHHLHVARVWAYTLTGCHSSRFLWLTNHCGMKRSQCVKTLRPLQQVKTAQTVWLLSVSWRMIYQLPIDFNRRVAKKHLCMLSGTNGGVNSLCLWTDDFMIFILICTFPQNQVQYDCNNFFFKRCKSTSLIVNV